MIDLRGHGGLLAECASLPDFSEASDSAAAMPDRSAALLRVSGLPLVFPSPPRGWSDASRWLRRRPQTSRNKAAIQFLRVGQARLRVECVGSLFCWETTMLKLFGATALAVLLCGPALAEKNMKVASNGRSYEECRDIAVARGHRYGKNPDRYLMLKGHGQKTNPQGLIARCMAGKP
jgi:hypothetical protein